MRETSGSVVKGWECVAVAVVLFMVTGATLAMLNWNAYRAGADICDRWCSFVIYNNESDDTARLMEESRTKTACDAMGLSGTFKLSLLFRRDPFDSSIEAIALVCDSCGYDSCTACRGRGFWQHAEDLTARTRMGCSCCNWGKWKQAVGSVRKSLAFKRKRGQRIARDRSLTEGLFTLKTPWNRQQWFQIEEGHVESDRIVLNP